MDRLDNQRREERAWQTYLDRSVIYDDHLVMMNERKWVYFGMRIPADSKQTIRQARKAVGLSLKRPAMQLEGE